MAIYSECTYDNLMYGSSYNISESEIKKITGLDVCMKDITECTSMIQSVNEKVSLDKESIKKYLKNAMEKISITIKKVIDTIVDIPKKIQKKIMDKALGGEDNANRKKLISKYGDLIKEHGKEVNLRYIPSIMVKDTLDILNGNLNPKTWEPYFKELTEAISLCYNAHVSGKGNNSYSVDKDVNDRISNANETIDKWSGEMKVIIAAIKTKMAYVPKDENMESHLSQHDIDNMISVVTKFDAAPYKEAINCLNQSKKFMDNLNLDTGDLYRKMEDVDNEYFQNVLKQVCDTLLKLSSSVSGYCAQLNSYLSRNMYNYMMWNFTTFFSIGRQLSKKYGKEESSSADAKPAAATA